VRPGSRQTARSACLPGSIEPTGSNTAADRPHRGRTRMKNSAQATACVTSPPWPILSGGRIACRAMTTGPTVLTRVSPGLPLTDLLRLTTFSTDTGGLHRRF
jgi:hypothetical protein